MCGRYQWPRSAHRSRRNNFHSRRRSSSARSAEASPAAIRSAQALSTVDPAPLALELRGQCRNGELDPLNVLFNRLVEAVRRRRRGRG